MPSSAQHSSVARFHGTIRALLLAGTALCGCATLGGRPARAATLPTQLSTNLATAGSGSVNTKVLASGGVTPATANYVSNGVAATITLVAPRTLIDWTTFEVSPGSSLNFVFSNAASDIVLNRVMGGAPGTNTITIDANGAVHGTFGGAVGGNIWFLAQDGVFIHGGVTASGVLASNNTTVADLNLLSDAASTLKGELAAGGSLIDLSGITAATAATIDGAGNLILSGPETVTGDAMLESTGSLTINAPIVAAGAVPVTLAYNYSSASNLSFGAGGSVTFANPDASAATSSAGGSLTINGTPYALLYKLAQPGAAGPDKGPDDVAGIDNNVSAGADGGYYALATDLAGAGTSAIPQFASALVGQGTNTFSGVFEGLGHTITGLTINDPVSGTARAGFENVGLFGVNLGTVRDLGLVGGSVVGANVAYVGAVVGNNQGQIAQSYATGAVSAGQDGAVGGLVGANTIGGKPGAITRSYATGAVSGAGASAATGNASAGGLVGANTGAITQTYATGAVSSGQYGSLGGLVGENSGSITEAYATGAVSGSGPVAPGGLIGLNMSPGVVAYGAFDTLTTGQVFGIGQDQNNQSANVAALATSQLQTGGLPLGFDATAWGGGSGGLYPFLTSFFPGGVQAVSGFAYAGFDRASLSSGATGAVAIGLIAGGARVGEATTGADGYYYIAAPAGGLTGGETLLVYTASGAPGAARLSTSSGATAQTGDTIFSGVLVVPTTALTLSASPNLTQAQAQALAGAGANGDARSAINAATGLGLEAIGASFAIDQPVTATAFGVQTAPGAPLTVVAPIVLNPGGELGLSSGGTLAINAPITANGATGVFLAYNPSSPTNFSFGNGATLTYATASGGPATSSQGGVLAINGQPYTLLYNLAQPGSTGPDTGVDDIAGIDANIAAGGAIGVYALATNLTGSGSAASPQFTRALAGAAGFNGELEGLGHTISNLTINDPNSGSSTSYETVGLFGSIGNGLVRDLGIVGASITGGSNYTNVGALAGGVYGSGTFIIQSYGAGSVSSGQNASVGGLVGSLAGQMLGDYFSGSVAGGGLGAVGGLVGGVTGGNISGSYATAAVSGTTKDSVGGLAGYNQGGVITDSYAAGAVSSGAGSVGGLVGYNHPSSVIYYSHADGPVSGGTGAVVGGLLGQNQGNLGVVYATGPVSAGDSSSVGGLVGSNSNGGVYLAYASGAVSGGAASAVGGLVGDNDVGGSIAQASASGPVNAGTNSAVGGFAGQNLGGLDQILATGAVSGGANSGGLAGHNGGAGAISAAAFDVLTTGKTAGVGLDDGAAAQSGNVAAMTTTQLQTGGLPAGFDPTYWGGGSSGLYPYLACFFPTGVQAVSGVAYSDAGVTALPSGPAGAVVVRLLAGGVPVGTAATGADGYYYIAASAGTFSAGEPLQASIVSGGPAENGFYTPTMNFVAQPGVNIYGSSAAAFILPSQGSINLAVGTTGGRLAGATLTGGVVTPGPVAYVSTGPVATLTLTASRTLIDWTTFEIGSGATLNFDFTNSPGDIVLNRLAGGTIAIDAGGAVNGFYGGATGGNVWFLAGNGVMFNGVVTAGGVLATNNTSVADLNLLSDAAATLKGKLAAGSLIDLTGAVSVTGAAIDGAGNILLTGAVDTGPAGAVNLISTGTITQYGGAITTGTLSGSSVGGATLAGANQVAAIGSFTNTGGVGFTLTDDVALSIAAGATVDAGAGTLTLVDTSSGIAGGAGSALKAGADIDLNVTGGAAAIGGAVTAGRDIVITAATFSDPKGALTAPNALTLALSDANGVSLTATPTMGLGSDIVAPTLLSPNVTIYEAATGAAPGGIGISTVTLPGVMSSLGLYTGGVVTVTGALLPGGSNVNLVIGGGKGSATPAEIKVQNTVGSGSAGGAIGSPGARFGLVSLTARGDILLGSPAFDSAAEQIPVTTSASAVNPLTPSPDPPFTPAIVDRSDNAVFLDVVNLVVAAGGRVLQQNTAGSFGAAPSGAVIGGNLTLDPYNGAGPQNLDLYALFVNPTLTGPASNRITLNVPSGPPGLSVYRIDGCVIGSAAACTGTGAASSAVVGSLFSSKPTPIVAPMQALPFYLLTQPEAADLADTSVIGATNEEIWRRPDRRKP